MINPILETELNKLLPTNGTPVPLGGEIYYAFYHTTPVVLNIRRLIRTLISKQ